MPSISQGMDRQRKRPRSGDSHSSDIELQTKPPKRRKGSVTETFGIKVNHLAKSISDKWLLSAFSHFGDVESVHLKAGREENYAFVNFYSLESALKAVQEMDGQVVDDVHMQVILQGRLEHQVPPTPDPLAAASEVTHEKQTLCTLKVTNIPKTTVSEQMLKRKFEAFGNLASLKLIETRDSSINYAWVNFTDLASATSAQIALNETPLVGDSKISVTFRHPSGTVPPRKSSIVPAQSASINPSQLLQHPQTGFMPLQPRPMGSIFSSDLKPGITTKEDSGSLRPSGGTFSFSLKTLAPQSPSCSRPAMGPKEDSRIPPTAKLPMKPVPKELKNLGKIFPALAPIRQPATTSLSTSQNKSQVQHGTTAKCPEALPSPTKGSTNVGKVSPAPCSKLGQQSSEGLSVSFSTSHVPEGTPTPSVSPAKGLLYQNQTSSNPFYQACQTKTARGEADARSQMKSKASKCHRPVKFSDELVEKILALDHEYTVEIEKIAIADGVTVRWGGGSGSALMLEGEPPSAERAEKKIEILAHQVLQNIKVKSFPLHCLYAPAFVATKTIEDMQAIEKRFHVSITMGAERDKALNLKGFSQHLQKATGDHRSELLKVSDLYPKFVTVNQQFSWLAEREGGGMQPLHPEVSKLLNYLYSPLGKKSFQHCSEEYAVDFEAMTLLEKEKGYLRKLRSEAPQWSYHQDDAFEFTPHSQEVCQAIESMMYFGNPVFKTSEGNEYTVDFDKMVQINLATGTTQSLKREPPVTESTLYECEFTLQVRGLEKNIHSAYDDLKSKLDSHKVQLTYEPPIQNAPSFQNLLINHARQYCVRARLVRTGTVQRIQLEGIRDYTERAELKIQQRSLHFQQEMLAGGPGVSAFPQEWEPQTFPKEFKIVLRGSQEWNFVLELMQKSLPSVQLQKLERIQDRPLWQIYNLGQQHMQGRNNGEVNEKYLFHGTRDMPPKVVITTSEKGIDFRFAREGLWGRAAYYAMEASYSDRNYAHRTKDGQKQLLLARVLTGHSIRLEPDRSLTMPPCKPVSSNRYDTVNGYTNRSRVFMVYDHDRAYPAYLITYTH